MQHGQKIVLKEEGDQFPDIIPGDIILVLDLKPHDTFVREGDDLLMEKDIQLVEALCGFSFNIKHLDGRTLVVKSQENGIVKPGEVKFVEGEGMPLQRNPMQKGKLLIRFNVLFPENGALTAETIKGLRSLLPPVAVPSEPTPEDAEEVSLSTPSPEELEGSEEDKDERYDSDEEGGGGGPGLACHPQ